MLQFEFNPRVACRYHPLHTFKFYHHRQHRHHRHRHTVDVLFSSGYLILIV